MSSFTIQIDPSFKKIGSAFQLIKLGAALQRAISKFAEAVRDESVKETPVDTGRLRASIATTIETLKARVGPHVVYAEWIHEGKMKRLGRTVYIKGLGKAGTPPGGKPFLRLGLRKVESRKEKIIKPELESEIKATFKGLAK